MDTKKSLRTTRYSLSYAATLVSKAHAERIPDHCRVVAFKPNAAKRAQFFKLGVKGVVELRRNTAKVIGAAISTPVSETRRAKTLELADRVRVAQASSVTARFQR